MPSHDRPGMVLSGLDGKVAVITGASRGIGRAIAELFASCGARLVLNYHTNAAAMEEVAAVCRQSGVEVATVAGDVGKVESAQAVTQAALTRFGRLDILVNNAGVVVEQLLLTTKDSEVERLLATNVLGAVWMARASLRPMLKQRAGAIINFSSVLASRPSRGNAIYAGTKGFVESFTRALAVEVGRKNIRVNAIAPGTIETDMTAAVRAMAAAAMKERIALQRFGTSSEVAAVAAFLASDQAAYLNGAIIPVDGAFLGGV